MKTEIVLELANSSGVHLKIMGALKKLGLRVTNLAIKVASSGGKLLVLEVEGDGEIDLDEVRTRLDAIEWVARIVRLGDQAAAGDDAPMPAAVETQPTADQKRYKNPDSEAGDEEIRDRMLIFSLLSRYPRISGRLVELKGDIPEEDHQDRFRQIGYGFGKHLVGNLRVKGPVTGLDEMIDRVVMPGIDPLARVFPIGDLLKVDLYRKDFDRGHPSPLHCAFLLGSIEGLLKGAPSASAFGVHKTGCVHRDDRSCEYRIVPDLPLQVGG